ncbi:hypothetical protein MD484_g8067, partial [Candolleomyces efflorescens]
MDQGGFAHSVHGWEDFFSRVSSRVTFFNELFTLGPNALSLINVAFHLFFAVLFFYYIVVVIAIVKSDIRMVALELIENNVFSINKCKSEFIANRCGTNLQPPALIDQCHNWGYCMLQNPNRLNTMSLFAEYAADSINAFVHRLSFRSACFIVASLATLVPIHYVWVDRLFSFISL